MADANTSEMALFVSTARAFLDKHASLDQVRALHAEDVSFDPQWCLANTGRRRITDQ